MNLFCRFKRLWVKPFFHISQSPPMRQVPQVGSSRSEADHHDLLKDHLEVATFPGVQVTLTFVHMSIELWSTNICIHHTHNDLAQAPRVLPGDCAGCIRATNSAPPCADGSHASIGHHPARGHFPLTRVVNNDHVRNTNSSNLF